MKRTDLIRCLRICCAIVLGAGYFSTLAAADWPQFRGVSGQGHSTATGLVTTWSETENVKWKAPIPGLGHSSPVVDAQRIWMSTAQNEGRSLRAICVERGSGQLLHNVEIFRVEDPGSIHGKNSYATPTPIIDGEKIYFHFGPNGTGCLDSNGQILWKNEDLEYRQAHAPASSPVLFENTLILTCDGNDNQFLTALDTQTGKAVWKTVRQHLEDARGKAASMVESRRGFALMAYSTPLVIDVAGSLQLVSTAADHVASYDPRSGEEIWWHPYDGFSEVARPVFGHGLVFVVGFELVSQPVIYAIRPEHRGRITKEHLAWRYDRSVSHVPSPLLVGTEIYLIGDEGIATCLDANTGRVHWKQRIGGNYSASPLYADEKIYCFSEEGKTTVLQPGTEFRVLATNHIRGRIMATPAAPGALFIRSNTHLYCLESLKRR